MALANRHQGSLMSNTHTHMKRDTRDGWKADGTLGSLRTTLLLYRGLRPSDTQQELQQTPDPVPDVQYKQTCGHPQDGIPHMSRNMMRVVYLERWHM